MPEFSWTFIRNTVGHFHPAVVHFPVGLVLAGAGLEMWQAARNRGTSRTARVLLVLGLLGAIAATLSGLSLLRIEDYQGRTLQAVSIHRILGLATASVLLFAAAASGIPGRDELKGVRLTVYRLAYGLSGLLVGLAGHYGGWAVFGWGSVWTP